jgi:thiamine pyrophosphokinase
MEQQEHEQQTPTKTALIILNYPIPSKSLLLKHLWKTSSTRIAADGGANRLYEYSKELIPDRIRGDLDSLDASVRAYYESQSVSVEQDFCQDTNDLDKALQILVSDDKDSSTTVDRVVIYGAFGGRFDQEMASFAALYKWAPNFNGQLYLYSDETCAFLIPANKDCEIRLPFYGTTHNVEKLERDIGEGPTCGLIPLGCRCESIVTSGLKWDLDGTMPLEFGGLVSSSNHIMEPTVKVFASHPLIFTAELVSKKAI